MSPSDKLSAEYRQQKRLPNKELKPSIVLAQNNNTADQF